MSAASFSITSLTAISMPIKDTDTEKAPPNKTPSKRKTTHMGIWAIDSIS